MRSRKFVPTKFLKGTIRESLSPRKFIPLKYSFYFILRNKYKQPSLHKQDDRKTTVKIQFFRQQCFFPLRLKIMLLSDNSRLDMFKNKIRFCDIGKTTKISVFNISQLRRGRFASNFQKLWELL